MNLLGLCLMVGQFLGVPGQPQPQTAREVGVDLGGRLGIQPALETFGRVGRGPRLLGESHEPVGDILAAAAETQEAGVALITVGFGTEAGGTIPIEMNPERASSRAIRGSATGDAMR